MINFLNKMADHSRKRAALLPDRFNEKKFDLPIFDLQLSSFDIIAEFKEKSPAEGRLIQPEVDRSTRAITYAKGGAAAISVLTEPSRFDGDIQHLTEIAASLEAFSLPAMRKDFLVDVKQIMESRVHGASGVLLIAALFSPSKLRAMLDCAFDFSMFVLLESFDSNDLDQCKSLLKESRYQDQAQKNKLLFGVNSRDLKTLLVNSDRLNLLAKELPLDAISVAESGLYSLDDVVEAKQSGYQMALIGTALMKSKQPDRLIQDLLSAGRGIDQ